MKIEPASYSFLNVEVRDRIVFIEMNRPERMNACDAKEHEEFRLKLQKDKDVELAHLGMKRDIAQSQATVMAEAMSKAKINIVGGDGQFFDQFMKAVTLGNSVDGAIQNSDSLKTFLKAYLDGDASLPEDLKQILSKPGLTQDAQNIAFATLLARIAKNPGEVIDGIKGKGSKG